MLENGLHCRRTLSAGTASASSLAKNARCGVFGHVPFPRRTGRSSVERWSQDVTDFSRPGVAALRYSHSSFIPKNECLQYRSEEHTSELQSRFALVCRLLLEKKKTTET